MKKEEALYLQSCSVHISGKLHSPSVGHCQHFIRVDLNRAESGRKGRESTWRQPVWCQWCQTLQNIEQTTDYWAPRPHLNDMWHAKKTKAIMFCSHRRYLLSSGLKGKYSCIYEHVSIFPKAIWCPRYRKTSLELLISGSNYIIELS